MEDLASNAYNDSLCFGYNMDVGVWNHLGVIMIFHALYTLQKHVSTNHNTVPRLHLLPHQKCVLKSKR